MDDLSLNCGSGLARDEVHRMVQNPDRESLFWCKKIKKQRLIYILRTI